MSVDVLSEIDRSARGVDSTTLIVNLSSSPVAIIGVGNRACNPSVGSAIDTPQLTGEVEASVGSTRRNQAAMRSGELERGGLTGIDVSGGETGGRLMLRGEATFSVDDEGLRGLIVADLTDVDGIVREHEVGVHDLSVGRDEGQVSGQLISINVASVRSSLTSKDRRSSGARGGDGQGSSSSSEFHFWMKEEKSSEMKFVEWLCEVKTD